MDKPRKVLEAYTTTFTFKEVEDNETFIELPDHIRQLITEDIKPFIPEGIQLKDLIVPRLIPRQSDIAQAKMAMGQGEGGAWTGSVFAAPECPGFVFQSRRIDAIKAPLERFCIRHRFVPHISGLKTMLLLTSGVLQGG